jgi:aminoglycoside phosphotransferase (APT) family kinase protein
MATRDWRELVDLSKLSEWMDAEGLSRGVIEEPALLAGGTQNILLHFKRDGQSFVLRRPPLHTVANGSATMRREARVLAVLASTDVPHPRLIAACADESVLGAAFYLMETVEGFNATVGLPALHAADPTIRRRMGWALVDGIAAVGRVDALAAGLGDLGHIDNFLSRQAGRWREQLEGYERYAGWPGASSIQGVATVGAWLDANCPDSFSAGLMHGDYHIANVMFANDGPELAAIVDWELTTVGDPLLDLGWLLATWPDANDTDTAITRVEPWDGFPQADELVSRYAGRSSRDLSGLLWYKVLACYKLGILLEGTYARAAAGKADPQIGQRLHGQTLTLFRRALRWLEIEG